MASSNPTLIHDPSAKTNPATSAYRHFGEIRRAPPSFYDGELSAFDSVLPPLLPANVVVEDPSEHYLLMANRSQSLGHGFGAYPQGWTSSPYPGMSTKEYNFVRERSNKFSAVQEPEVYTSPTLWGTHFGKQGPWVVPGVAPASQSKHVTREMINQAGFLPPMCQIK